VTNIAVPPQPGQVSNIPAPPGPFTNITATPQPGQGSNMTGPPQLGQINYLAFPPLLGQVGYLPYQQQLSFPSTQEFQIGQLGYFIDYNKIYEYIKAVITNIYFSEGWFPALLNDDKANVEV